MTGGGLCEQMLAGVDHEILLVGKGGRILYANACAQRTLGQGEGAAIEDIFVGADEDWRKSLRGAAQSSTLVPINLKVCSGPHRGLDMKFRARGMQDPDSGEAALMLVADRNRDTGFSELKRLVRDLNGQLARRKLLQEKLESALESEQRLHHELIHRVKNNLTLLTSLIHFRQQSSEDEAVNEVLDDLEHRILAIQAVHEILDRAGEIDWVQAGDLIKRLCEQLGNSLAGDNIRIENELLDVKLNVRDATPLALLINELITNAIKHAFPDGSDGKVVVSLQKNGEDKLEVRIADNGHGIMEKKSSGSGSALVNAFARQIGGELERHSDGKGTRWTFIFPHREEPPEREIEIVDTPRQF